LHIFGNVEVIWWNNCKTISRFACLVASAFLTIDSISC